MTIDRGVGSSDDQAKKALLGGPRQLGPFVVSAIGYGAMRLAGPRMFGPPAGRGEAVAVLREAVRLGVTHIDTSQYYGPEVVNQLIREALYPYPADLVLVSKVGARRTLSGGIEVDDAPEALRRGIEENLSTLGVEQIAAVNLRMHRGPEADPLFEDQLAAMEAARRDGLIGAIGISNVSLEQLLAAVRVIHVACVQNIYNPGNRSSEDVLEECRRRRIAFVPFGPLGSGAYGEKSVLSAPTVVALAERLGCSPAQLMLAWALQRAENILLIPGTSSLRHLRENVAAGSVELDEDALAVLDLSAGTR